MGLKESEDDETYEKESMLFSITGKHPLVFGEDLYTFMGLS